MFPCEACGHPLNRHNPCNDVVGKGKKQRICGCPQFEPEDLQRRVASLTDTADPRSAIAQLATGGKP